MMSEKTLYRILGLAALSIVGYVIACLAGMNVSLAFRLAEFTILIPLLIGLVTAFKKPVNLTLVLLLAFISITFAFTVYEFYLQLNKESNLFLMEYYSPVEYTLLALTFYSVQSIRHIRNFVLGSIVVFLIIWVLSITVFPSVRSFNNTILTFESILLCGIAVLTLVDMGRNNFVFTLHPGFWIIIAVLIYFAGNLIFFALWHLILPDSILPAHGRPEESHLYWIIHHVLNISMHLLYSVSFLCRHVRATS